MSIHDTLEEYNKEVSDVTEAIEWLKNDCVFDDWDDVPDRFVSKMVLKLEQSAKNCIEIGYYDDAITLVQLLKGSIASSGLKKIAKERMTTVAQVMRSEFLHAQESRFKALENDPF